MAKTTTTSQLASAISRLHAERQEHLDAISEIDAIFDQFGITAAAPKRRGRPRKTARRTRAIRKAAKKVRRGKRKARRKFATSGPNSILAFVRQGGRKGRTTGDIIRHWKSEGRGAGAYVLLGKMVRERKLKKENLEGQRGSRYTVA